MILFVHLQHMSEAQILKTDCDIPDPEDIIRQLEQVRILHSEGSLSTAEKRKLVDLYDATRKQLKLMADDMKQDIDAPDCEGRVLIMHGSYKSFYHDFFKAGVLCIPRQEELTLAIQRHCNWRRDNSALSSATKAIIPVVVSIKQEDNFSHLRDGPQSPNYLLTTPTVNVIFETVEQAEFLLGVAGAVSIPGYPLPFEFFKPQQDSATRAAYNAIGSHITRLKKIDDELRTLGAVPGRGGVPQLPENFISPASFDQIVAKYQENNDKFTLHNWLCTRMRLDVDKKQAKLDRLVNARIEVLLQLAKHNFDEYPVVVEREYKA